MSSKIAAILTLVTLLHVLASESAPVTPTANQIKAKLNSIHMIDKLHHQIRAKEEEFQKAENINKNFEKMIQLVNILGQIDTFLSERTKAVIKKLAQLVDDEEDENSNSIRD